MVIGRKSDEDIFESIYMAKHKNKDFAVKVGEDDKCNEYFYMGNNIFLRKPTDGSSSFDLMELPVSKERTGNVAMISVIPDLALIKFYAPLCSGFQVVVAEAVWEGFDSGWNLINKVAATTKNSSSIDDTLSELENSYSFYGKTAPRYAAELRRIIESTCALEEEKSKGASLSKRRK